MRINMETTPQAAMDLQPLTEAELCAVEGGSLGLSVRQIVNILVKGWQILA